MLACWRIDDEDARERFIEWERNTQMLFVERMREENNALIR